MIFSTPMQRKSHLRVSGSANKAEEAAEIRVNSRSLNVILARQLGHDYSVLGHGCMNGRRRALKVRRIRARGQG